MKRSFQTAVSLILYDPPWLIRLYDKRLRFSDLIVELYNILFVYINVYISYELSKYHMISCGLLLCRMYTGITKCFQFEEGALQPCGVLSKFWNFGFRFIPIPIIHSQQNHIRD